VKESESADNSQKDDLKQQQAVAALEPLQQTPSTGPVKMRVKQASVSAANEQSPTEAAATDRKTSQPIRSEADRLTTADEAEPEKVLGRSGTADAPESKASDLTTTTASPSATDSIEQTAPAEASNVTGRLERDASKEQCAVPAEAERMASAALKRRGRPKLTGDEKAANAEGRKRTRAEREKEALELWASVEVRKQKLQWLEGEVARMSVHAAVCTPIFVPISRRYHCTLLKMLSAYTLYIKYVCARLRDARFK
jgi:hypothetical protein